MPVDDWYKVLPLMLVLSIITLWISFAHWTTVGDSSLFSGLALMWAVPSWWCEHSTPTTEHNGKLGHVSKQNGVGLKPNGNNGTFIYSVS